MKLACSLATELLIFLSLSQGKEVIRVRLEQTGEIIEVEDEDHEKVCLQYVLCVVIEAGKVISFLSAPPPPSGQPSLPG